MKMKKIKLVIAAILTFALLLSLTGCAEVKKAEKAVNGVFTALKSLDFDAAQKYMDIDEIVGENNDMNVIPIMEAIFDDLNYEILSAEKVDSSNVIVKTKITAIDMKPVMTDFTSKSIEYVIANAFADPAPTQEETNKKIEEILIECASGTDLATVTNEVDIKVIKTEDKEWKIEADDTFVNALLGGLIKTVEEMDSTLTAEE